jgi:hypothetical protein
MLLVLVVYVECNWLSKNGALPLPYGATTVAGLVHVPSHACVLISPPVPKVDLLFKWYYIS